MSFHSHSTNIGWISNLKAAGELLLGVVYIPIFNTINYLDLNSATYLSFSFSPHLIRRLNLLTLFKSYESSFSPRNRYFPIADKVRLLGKQTMFRKSWKRKWSGGQVSMCPVTDIDFNEIHGNLVECTC